MTEHNTPLPLLDDILDDLASQGWSVQSLALPAELTAALATECRRRYAAGALTRAAIGRAGGQTLDESIRGDHIQWLAAGETATTDAYLGMLDSLRERLNRELFLGLEDYECHFALYPPGSFYRRHLDRFRDDDRRTVTTVFYLNEDWRPEHGGALRIELADGREHDVPPAAGTLVVFMSGDFPHEVLPASRERLSLTGWYRRRGNGPL
ncbi:2OG-Fe(II) oxygenase [Pseudomonas sp. MAP12]|uniref:2OG-Fe(II) oxygenase n=1 Tax=Geopseudomonas aromaticivorans TaxID=2849492 RepID=A0ABS6MZD0_9GAMM|nr:2OG-Fe(II) oxygenase [Pseudomonas aromaticivorans]MBV2134146.1 2OG-Fe(II) oxygenase [Pseudomonas aromaticivorans]